MDRTEEDHVKWSKPGSERQSSLIFSYIWKIDPNINISIITYTYINTKHISNRGTIRGD
jgi:hypothetical protein